MAADAHAAYLADRAAGNDALLIADTWEVADALNHRLHSALTVEGPAVHADRNQQIRKGDIIISRRNDATVDVRPGPGYQRGARVSQVRNGNRWRVAGRMPPPGASPPNASPTRPAPSSNMITCATTSHRVMPPPCTPPKG